MEVASLFEVSREMTHSLLVGMGVRCLEAPTAKGKGQIGHCVERLTEVLGQSVSFRVGILKDLAFRSSFPSVTGFQIGGHQF